MSEANVINVRIKDEFFETKKELVNFVAGYLRFALESWPERACGRRRVVNLERYDPRMSVVYRVEYLPDPTLYSALGEK